MGRIKTFCTICRTKCEGRTEVSENVGHQSNFNNLFSARRVPDRVTFKWVRCSNCNLLRADEIVDLNLEELYRKSKYSYSREERSISSTYSKILFKEIPEIQNNSTRFLEVGCGNGFLLEDIQRRFGVDVHGVEPSEDAHSNSSPFIKKRIVKAMFSSQLFVRHSFDIVAAFHVLDHLEDPLVFLENIKEILKSGGFIFIAVHNEKGILNRLLKAKSPIYDIEHRFLFSQKTLRLLLETAGFKNISVRNYLNRYSIQYAIEMSIMPKGAKDYISNIRVLQRLLKITLPMPLGNIYAIARLD